MLLDSRNIVLNHLKSGMLQSISCVTRYFATKNIVSNWVYLYYLVESKN